MERWLGLMQLLGRRGWSAAEINDWLWLARTLAEELPESPMLQIDGSKPEPENGEDGEPILDHSGSGSAGNQQTQGSSGSPGTTLPPTPSTPPSSEGALLAPITAENKDSAATPRVGITETALIRRPRKLGRALAPLNRWQEEGAPCLLDVAATVEAIATARSERMPWQPSLRPRRQPWLELQLVFDGSPSMALWQRLRKELPRLLAREVRWRDLRCWQVLIEPNGTVTLADLRGHPCAPRRLRQRTDRSLVLVVSDAVAPAWYQGAMAELLQGWAAVQPVALLELLPQRLWLRTALVQQPAGWIRSTTPMRPHGHLVWQPVEGGAPRPGQAGATPWLTLPVLQLRPEFLGPWARMLVGSRQGSALAYRFALPQRRSPQPQEDKVAAEEATAADTEDLLAVFLFTASARARKLLALLTFAPVITLPIVRLIQGQMLGQLGEEGVAEQAEVLFSGLFAPATAPPPRPVPIDQQLLRFEAEDLRPRLREGLRVWEARAVFERVQTYVIERLNLSQDQFEALLLSPEQCESHPDQNLLRAFALAAPSCLRGLGGRYEDLADQLEQRWRREQGPEDKFWKGFVVREEEFETAQLVDVPQLQAIPFITARFEELELRPIPFNTATLKSDHTTKESPGTAWGFHDPLQRDHLPFAATAEQAELLALTLVEIPAGSFQMGSPPDERERSDAEGPQHEVELASFFISQTPITQAQWREVAGWQEREGERWGRELKANPSRFQPKDAAEEEKEPYGLFRLLKGEASSDQRPVEQVSWLDVMEFCHRLSQRTGRFYTLPSEAQWEYACRAGTTTPFAFGETITSELANYDGTYTYGNGPKGIYRQQTTPVGTFPANAWGLQDMHGNVDEWCLDDWHESYEGAPSDGSAWVDGAEGKSSKRGEESKLLRGGSWGLGPRGCRSAHRALVRPDDANGFIGFRVVCLPQGPSLNA
jgi:formylglycine-generating enzyme required for sulfatase activity